MDTATYRYLKAQPNLIAFIRQQPNWYRYLSRDGMKRVQELEREAKIFHGKTFTQRLDRINHQVQMASMLINVADLLKD